MTVMTDQHPTPRTLRRATVQDDVESLPTTSIAGALTLDTFPVDTFMPGTFLAFERGKVLRGGPDP